jgi:threonine/homoserine/homoserine lactone efflux protein
METDRIDWVVAAVVIATAAATGWLVVLGFADPDRLLPGSASSAARTLTYYESVRTVVLVGAAIWLLLRRRRRLLRLALILNAITQCGDAVIGLAVRHSAPGALGPACFAAALAYAAWRLGRQAAHRNTSRHDRPRDPRRQALLMGGPRIRRPRTP